MASLEETKSNSGKSAEGYIAQRYVFAVMGFLAVANAYAMRNVLNLAITEMVVAPHGKGHLVIDRDACPDLNHIGQINRTDPTNDFDWNEETQGAILSAFYWGYVITHIPGGIIAEHFGGKHVVGYGMLSTVLGTLLTPLAARQGPNWLVAVRFLEGLGEGTTFPALNALLAQWAPPLERGIMCCLVFAGNQIGIVLSSTLAGYMLEGPFQWPGVFYFFGTIGLIWYVGWLLLCYNDPASHPYISKAERAYLKNTIGHLKRNEELRGVPWKDMLLSIPLWALVIGQIGHDWGLFMILTDLPKYMKSVLKFSVHQNGVLSSLPFLIMWLMALFAGWFSDLLVSKRVFSLTTVRKLFATIASIGPAAGVVAASYAGCDRATVVTLFTVGMAFMGFFYPSLKLNTLDLSPNYAGTLMAIVNGIGAISGIVSPMIVGLLASNNTMHEWREVFWITFVVIMFTNIVYLLAGSGEVQPWNDSHTSSDEEAIKTKKHTDKYTEENEEMEMKLRISV